MFHGALVVGVAAPMLCQTCRPQPESEPISCGLLTTGSSLGLLKPKGFDPVAEPRLLISGDSVESLLAAWVPVAFLRRQIL